MAAIFDMPIESETLNCEEIAQITGCARKGDQLEWLDGNGWIFHKNKAGEPIVGRLYARFKLAGIDLERVSPAAGLPDFSKAR